MVNSRDISGTQKKKKANPKDLNAEEEEEW